MLGAKTNKKWTSPHGHLEHFQIFVIKLVFNGIISIVFQTITSLLFLKILSFIKLLSIYKLYRLILFFVLISYTKVPTCYKKKKKIEKQSPKTSISQIKFKG